MKRKKGTTINISAIILAAIVIGSGFIAITSLQQAEKQTDANLITGDAVKTYENTTNKSKDQKNSSKPEKNSNHEKKIRPAKSNSSDPNTSEREKDSKPNPGFKSSKNKENGNNKASKTDSNFGIEKKRTIRFDASDSTEKNIERYKWRLGNGETAYGEKVKHRYLPGTYNVELTVIDKQGNKDTFNRTIRVEK
jgi:cytoskeletal protein RodZ